MNCIINYLNKDQRNKLLKIGRHFWSLVTGHNIYYVFCISGVHVEEEAEEREVDTSLRGRLLSLVVKVKSLRKKKEEEEPEPEEEVKPSEQNTTTHFVKIES